MIIKLTDYEFMTNNLKNIVIKIFPTFLYMTNILDKCLHWVIWEALFHRIEWRMVGGNPVEKHYDKFCQKYRGKKYVLTDVLKDRCGKYHNDVIYEIIFKQEADNG